jgi:hypothetical protein
LEAVPGDKEIELDEMDIVKTHQPVSLRQVVAAACTGLVAWG